MILHNPTGRAVRLEIPMADESAMTLTIGAHASIDLARYQKALEAVQWAQRLVDDMPDQSSQDPDL